MMKKRPMFRKRKTTAQVFKPPLAKLYLDECLEEPGGNTREEMEEDCKQHFSKFTKTKTTPGINVKTKTPSPSQPEHNSVYPRGIQKRKLPTDPNNKHMYRYN